MADLVEFSHNPSAILVTKSKLIESEPLLTRLQRPISERVPGWDDPEGPIIWRVRAAGKVIGVIEVKRNPTKKIKVIWDDGGYGKNLTITPKYIDFETMDQDFDWYIGTVTALGGVPRPAVTIGNSSVGSHTDYFSHDVNLSAVYDLVQSDPSEIFRTLNLPAKMEGAEIHSLRAKLMRLIGMI